MNCLHLCVNLYPSVGSFSVQGGLCQRSPTCGPRQYLLSDQHQHSIRSKMPNKSITLESSRNQPPSPCLWKNCFPWNQFLVPKWLRTASCHTPSHGGECCCYHSLIFCIWLKIKVLKIIIFFNTIRSERQYHQNHPQQWLAALIMKTSQTIVRKSSA